MKRFVIKGCVDGNLTKEQMDEEVKELRFYHFSCGAELDMGDNKPVFDRKTGN